MTTRLINGDYTNDLNAFRSPAQPTNPLPFLFALADCIHQHGTNWIASNEGKALLFPLLMMAYGSVFTLDSLAEYQRLDEVIPQA